MHKGRCLIVNLQYCKFCLHKEQAKRDRRQAKKDQRINIKENFRFRFRFHSVWMGLNNTELGGQSLITKNVYLCKTALILKYMVCLSLRYSFELCLLVKKNESLSGGQRMCAIGKLWVTERVNWPSNNKVTHWNQSSKLALCLSNIPTEPQ